MTKKIPDHQLIYQKIRDAILFGALVPGQAVTILGLTARTGAGMTPVREAIRRLTAEGALRLMDNRRIVVPKLSADEIAQLNTARQAIEPKMAEMAAKSADKALMRQLAGIDAELDQAISSGDVENYLLLNYRFHFAIYNHSGAEILCQMAQSLWLRSGPSLRVVCGRFGTSNLPDMHSDMIAAFRANDSKRAAAAMAEDIEQGMSQIRAALENDTEERRLDASALVK